MGLFLLACLIMLGSVGSVTSVALAQEGATSKAAIIGFSADGKYVAYEVYGDSAISPDGHSIIRIVNVAKNRFVGKRIIHGEEYVDGVTMDTIRAAARKKAGILFRRLGIIPGERPGEEINIREKRDPDTQGGFRIDFTANKGYYQLELFEKIYLRKGLCREQLGDTKMKIFTLRLKERISGGFKILQKDRKLYKSRGCVFDYYFDSAYTYEDSLVVFINAKSINHEGPQLTQLVVTGTLRFRYR